MDRENNLRLESYTIVHVLVSYYLQSETCTIRTRKFLTNRLLQRKQMVSTTLFSPSL